MQVNDDIAPIAPKVLVIGPGGIKGLMALGFLTVLDDHNWLSNINTYCGVSVGAIISLLLVVGYRPRKIITELLLMDIFKHETFDIHALWNHKGLLSNEPVRKKLIELVKNIFGIVPTLHELYLLTGKSLITTTLNATDEICMMFDQHTQPNISCVDAVMFSMNIPFIFYQLVHQGKIYIDGALANAYPVDYVDNNNERILGIYMRTSCQTTPTIKRIIEPIEPNNEISFVQYAHKMVQFILDQQRNSVIKHSSDKCMHICLECDIIDATGLTVSIQEKARLIIHGYNEGRRFIENGYEAPVIQNLKFQYPNIPNETLTEELEIDIIAEINNSDNNINI